MNIYWLSRNLILLKRNYYLCTIQWWSITHKHQPPARLCWLPKSCSCIFWVQHDDQAVFHATQKAIWVVLKNKLTTSQKDHCDILSVCVMSEMLPSLLSIYDPVPLLNIFEQSYQSALMLSLCKCACHTYIYTHKLQMRVTHTSYPESNFLRLMPVTCQDLQRPGVAESCLGSSETLYSKVPTSPEVVPTGSNREIRLDKSEKRQHAWHFQI